MSEVALHESKDGTGAGLLEFLEWAANRGELTPSTARATAVSTRKILAVEADPGAVNVLTTDPEDLFNRFQTLHRTEYTSDSMTVYRSRFLNAVAMYRAWLDKKPNWKTAGGWGRRASRPNGKGARDGSTAKRRKTQDVTASLIAAPQMVASGETVATNSSASGAPAMVPYDLPLRPGLRVRLVLPEMLTRADADRIAAFVHSLAFGQVEDERDSS